MLELKPAAQATWHRSSVWILMVQSFKQFGANLTQAFGLWVFWNGTYLKIPIWLVIDDSYDIICDFFKVGLVQRTPNLLESISTQNPLFWVVPTVHTQRFRELCQKSSVEKMLCFLCCSRVVSDMAEVRFMWIFHEVGRNFISIVAVFFSLFSKTEDKTGVEPVQTSLSFVIRYSLYLDALSGRSLSLNWKRRLFKVCQVITACGREASFRRELGYNLGLAKTHSGEKSSHGRGKSFQAKNTCKSSSGVNSGLRSI